MMNKQKTSKAGLWKVATFLPLLALLLMAFGKAGENVQMDRPSERHILNQEKTIIKESATQLQSKDSIYLVVEVMPEFPGGEKGKREYIANNTVYPENAKANRISGKAYINFVINKEGKVTNANVLRSSKNPELDAEALRLVRQMPAWTPGKEKGVPVLVSHTMPITFVVK